MNAPASTTIGAPQAALLRKWCDRKHGVASGRGRLQAFYKDGDRVRKITLRRMRFAEEVVS